MTTENFTADLEQKLSEAFPDVDPGVQPLGGRVERRHHPLQRELRRRPGQAEPAPRPEGRRHHPGARQLVQGLRQVVAGHVQRLGDLAHRHGAPARPGVVGQVQDGAKGVGGRLGQHREPCWILS